MALSKEQKRGDAARAFVILHYPEATSCYTENGAEVYQPGTNEVLGSVVTTADFPVELAWVNAAEKLLPTPLNNLGSFKQLFYDSAVARFSVVMQYPYANERDIEEGMGVEIYDLTSNTVLGKATYVDFANQQAWLDAAEKLKATA